jgi:hypothetical protein
VVSSARTPCRDGTTTQPGDYRNAECCAPSGVAGKCKTPHNCAADGDGDIIPQQKTDGKLLFGGCADPRWCCVEKGKGTRRAKDIAASRRQWPQACNLDNPCASSRNACTFGFCRPKTKGALKKCNLYEEENDACRKKDGPFAPACILSAYFCLFVMV